MINHQMYVCIETMKVAWLGCLLCRVAPYLDCRVGGHGAVVFAQHVNSPSSLYALKFFFLFRCV